MFVWRYATVHTYVWMRIKHDIHKYFFFFLRNNLLECIKSKRKRVSIFSLSRPPRNLRLLSIIVIFPSEKKRKKKNKARLISVFAKLQKRESSWNFENRPFIITCRRLDAIKKKNDPTRFIVFLRSVIASHCHSHVSTFLATGKKTLS